MDSEARILPHGWEKHHSTSDPLPEYPLLVKYLKFVFSLSNLVDVVSFLPYLVQLVSSRGVANGNNFIRICRIVRVFRILNRHSEVNMMVMLIGKTVRKSFLPLVVLLLISLLVSVFFGSVMFAFEAGEFTVSKEYPDGEYLRSSYRSMFPVVTPFNSIGISMYYAITTVTTGAVFLPAGWLTL
jgi:hypothetical protein